MSSKAVSAVRHAGSRPTGLGHRAPLLGARVRKPSAAKEEADEDNAVLAALLGEAPDQSAGAAEAHNELERAGQEAESETAGWTGEGRPDSQPQANEVSGGGEGEGVESNNNSSSSECDDEAEAARLREIEEEEAGLCAHVGCSWQSGAATARDRRISSRKHKRALSVHMEHFRDKQHECPLCQRLVEEKVWTLYEYERIAARIARNAAAAVATTSESGAAALVPAGRERDESSLNFKAFRAGQKLAVSRGGGCDHDGCLWVSVARHASLRADACRNHIESIAAHREHAAACGLSCARCKDLAARGIWSPALLEQLTRAGASASTSADAATGSGAPAFVLPAPSVMTTRLNAADPSSLSGQAAVEAAMAAAAAAGIVYYGELQTPQMPALTAAKAKRQNVLDSRATNADRAALRAAVEAEASSSAAELAVSVAAPVELTDEVLAREIGLLGANVQSIVDADLRRQSGTVKQTAELLHVVGAEVAALRTELQLTWLQRYSVSERTRRKRAADDDADDTNWDEYHRERKRKRLLQDQAPIRTRITETESVVAAALTAPARANFWVGFTQDILQSISHRLVACDGVDEAMTKYKQHGQLNLTEYLDRYQS